MEIAEVSCLNDNISYIKYSLVISKYSNNNIAFSCFIKDINFNNIKDLIKELKNKYNEEEYSYLLKNVETNEEVDINDCY
jgi:hypothetical protein